MMIVILSSTIVCYALYSTSNPEKPHMIFTTIFVVYGVLRYNYIINTTNENNPTDIVLKDNALKNKRNLMDNYMFNNIDF
ncbi:hypothetical protein BM530_22425, partial [Clostridioides difficile]